MNIDITEYIPYGRKNAVSRHELQRRTGLPDRTVRALIEDARRKGAHILSSSADKGYWKSNNVGEIKEFLRESDGRIRKQHRLWKRCGGMLQSRKERTLCR